MVETKKLTARGVQSAKGPAFLSDGEGLYLQVKASGAKSWVYRCILFGKRAELGLGSALNLSLAEAREKRGEFRRLIKAGKDPRETWGRTRPSFREIAKETFEARRGKWTSEAHAQRWWASLEKDVLPKIGRREIADIGCADMLGILGPIWTKKPDTARRIAQRLSAVFDWAVAKGHYEAGNPLQPALVALGKQNAARKHMAAMPWQSVPDFFGQLERQEGIAAVAHTFLILTATRAGETLGARWAEIEGETWTIPGDRMKMGRPHRIPLSSPALACLERVKGVGGDLIFPSPVKTRGPQKPMVSNALTAVRDRMGVEGVTTHGFRSTFRTWASDSARATREVAEISLAHLTGNAVERAYQRSDLLDQRRQLMDAWARYLTKQAGEVVQLVR